MGKNSGSGSGKNNPGHISGSLEKIFWVKILKFFDADPGSGLEKIRIRNKQPPQHCCAGWDLSMVERRKKIFDVKKTLKRQGQGNDSKNAFPFRGCLGLQMAE
jgi:hypothetical protein